MSDSITRKGERRWLAGVGRDTGIGRRAIGTGTSAVWTWTRRMHCHHKADPRMGRGTRAWRWLRTQRAARTLSRRCWKLVRFRRRLEGPAYTFRTAVADVARAMRAEQRGRV